MRSRPRLPRKGNSPRRHPGGFYKSTNAVRSHAFTTTGQTLPNVVEDTLDKSPCRFAFATLAIGRRRVALFHGRNLIQLFDACLYDVGLFPHRNG